HEPAAAGVARLPPHRDQGNGLPPHALSRPESAVVADGLNTSSPLLLERRMLYCRGYCNRTWGIPREFAPGADHLMANKRTILIVDDDAELREALVEQLALHEEFEPISADSGTKGVQAARNG